MKKENVYLKKLEVMETLLLQSNSKEEIKLLASLANKMGLKAKVIKNDFLEDIALANAMQKEKTGEYIDTESYLKKLKTK